MSRAGRKKKGDPKGEALSSAGLRARTWKRFLRGPDPTLLDDLYVPGLAEAVRYDRCCAYFSSTALAAAARGFGRLIERLVAMGEAAPRPAARLVVNEEMTAEDVRAMTETGDTRRLEEALLKRFKNPKELLAKQRLAMLGWLAKAGLLDIRVGVMRQGGGIVHAKFGIMTDPAGDAVVFSGSGNESAQGLIANYEQIEVSTSWEDPARHRNYAEEFDLLWADRHADVHTVTLPEALRLKLIRFAPKEPPIFEPSDALARQKAAMIWQFMVEAPYLADGGATCDATAMVDLWPHQRRVVEETAAAWPDGRLLCDEVGMGKTIEAVLVLRRLMAGRGVRRALLLAPAGLLGQWQAELREKGGLVVPRLEGLAYLVWPDETRQPVKSLGEALKQDVLLMSRETARLEKNFVELLSAEPWDLALLDEAHAARRRKQEEGEFNSGNLLLNLLRQLQLRRRARGILLLSATPMQLYPWEPWDLLAALGEGGAWLAEFRSIRAYYGAIHDVRRGCCGLETARAAAALILADGSFPPAPGGLSWDSREALATELAFVPPTRWEALAEWLRRGSPLARRMHRNTRSTLRQYWQGGLLPSPPPTRRVIDIRHDYQDARERAVYDAIVGYIDRRYEQLEAEKRGKGFVMTVYRRRAASSPRALRESLLRRREGLNRVIQQKAYAPEIPREDAPEALDPDDIPEGGSEGRISAALPDNPETARKEREEVETLLNDLQALGACDSKRDRFFSILKEITADGRPALVFTEYVDTMNYLREALVEYYGERLGCYSGQGGFVWNGQEWNRVTKDAITRDLERGRLAMLICTDAASEGLNLQAAGALVNYDLPWNPSKVEQRIGRIDRIGQKRREIVVANLFLKDSVDDKVYEVLRRRCSLFERFVGAMQPVLEQARRMLKGAESVDLQALAAQADEAERDLLAQETYMEDAAREPEPSDVGVCRKDMESALDLLTGEFGPRAARIQKKGLVEVRGLAKKLLIGATVESLESNDAAAPLTPLDPNLRKLARQLAKPGERLPLVIGSHRKEAFRCSVAYWIGDGCLSPVRSMKALQVLVDRWDGKYPSPQDWQTAAHEAGKEAAVETERMCQTARERERGALRRQIEACRQRLLRELGRLLVCAEGSVRDLNRAIHRLMSRDMASARRLQKCLEKFRGYPEWDPGLREELDAFRAQMSEGARAARLLGSEVDAALDDPRWTASAAQEGNP